jgi:lysozyme family protein
MADSKISIAKTLVHEGGYQCIPSDSGNWTGGAVGVGTLKGTKYGIAASTHPQEDIENLTTDRATQIYQEEYWKTHYSEIVSQPIADQLFDCGVLMGVGTVVKILQTVLKITADGIFGPNTVACVNGVDQPSLKESFSVGLVLHAIGVSNANPAEGKIFLGGWIRRVHCPNCGFKH